MRRLLIAAAVALACAAPAQARVKVFLLQGEQFGPVYRSGSGAGAALQALLAGPTAKERSAGYRTALPRGTRVVRLRAEPRRATVSLRLPTERSTPFRASLAAARAAQVAFTLRALGYDRVTLFVNGHSVATPSSVLPSVSRPEPPELEPTAPAPADVLSVQSQLSVLRYLPKDAVTGIWDYRTEQAVLALQSWMGVDRDGVVGPRTLAALAEASIPFPSPSADGHRIEVYRDRGVALLVSQGVVVRAIHVSSGAPGFATPGGTFAVFRKERFSWSVPYKVWLPFASYFFRGVAFHAYAEIPNRPASHGCVRVPYPEASTVYAFGTLGTTVIVY